MEPVVMAIHAANIALLLGLLYVYTQNAAKIRSKITYGLVVFVFLLLAQSAMDFYFELNMVMYSTTAADTAAHVLGAVKAVAFAVLLWVSWE